FAVHFDDDDVPLILRAQRGNKRRPQPQANVADDDAFHLKRCRFTNRPCFLLHRTHTRSAPRAPPTPPRRAPLGLPLFLPPPAPLFELLLLQLPPEGPHLLPVPLPAERLGRFAGLGRLVLVQNGPLASFQSGRLVLVQDGGLVFAQDGRLAPRVRVGLQAKRAGRRCLWAPERIKVLRFLEVPGAGHAHRFSR